MEKSLDYDYILKYILVGDTSVGKSTMLNKFLNDAFTAESNPTMGVEFATKKINVDGTNIKIQIWDTVTLRLYRLDRSLLEPSLAPTIRTPSESF